jgi:hypothetical protein
MLKGIFFTEKEYNQLGYKILENIIRTAKKGYGCKFISRETKKEMDDLQVTGLFAHAIQKELNL